MACLWSYQEALLEAFSGNFSIVYSEISRSQEQLKLHIY